jgi:hypothetical protein
MFNEISVPFFINFDFLNYFAGSLVAGNLSPRFTADMNGHLIPESTPPRSPVYQLKGEDPEGVAVRFGVQNSDLFNVDPVTGVVTLLKKLDREVLINPDNQLTVSLGSH